MFVDHSGGAEKDSITVGGGGGVPQIVGAVPTPRPAVLDSPNNGTQHGPRTPQQTVLNDRGRRYVEKRFKSKQALSTFISTLVIAYIAFATHVQHRDLAHGIAYNFGIFFALFAITAHGISTILAAQRIAKCNDLSMECTEEDLEYTLAVCSIFQFVGTTCFIVAVMGSVFLFFDQILYVVLFSTVSFAGLVAFVIGNGELTRVHANVHVIRTTRKVPKNRNQEA